MTLLSGKRPTLDPTCAEAVDVARDALVDMAPAGTVGDHLGAEPEQERMALHLFEALLPGYRDWRWAVTVMRASRSKRVTIGETVLLPGPDSLLSPEWVPWTERLRPGDLGVGDVLPTEEDDARLEPGWNALDDAVEVIDRAIEDGDAAGDAAGAEIVDEGETPAWDDDSPESAGDDGWVDADAVLAVALELDLARPRVLSPIGLDDATDRWIAGDQGPSAAIAQSAPAQCLTCGFRIPLKGSLGHAFGLCANEISPSDGRVVSLDHGCGAHSEAVVVPTMAERPDPVIDEVGYESVEREVPSDVGEGAAETPEAAEAAEGTTDAATPDVAPESAVEPDHG
ncbi:MAG: DUF3027 domain-containing protein [Actinomycetes bacterium]